MIINKESEFQYQNALALVLSAAQLCKFKEEDSYKAERGHSDRASALYVSVGEHYLEYT